MLVSMRSLSDYYKIESTVEEYISDITMSGTKVEAYEYENQSIKNVVVGEILSIEKHPDADSLVICQVNVGEETVQIVTGADNISVGDLVPVALHKSLLPNGTKITKGKLRGEVSQGMLCSLEELELSLGDFPYAEEDGIFILQEEDIHPGMPIDDAIGLNDLVIEFEITSNRPDCMSVLGIARETAATYGDKFVPTTPVVKGGGTDVNEILSVEVENTELCQRYMAAAVEDVKIEPSPRWLRERLRAMGVRPINNIVDITNYVMLEYGHPMHAFDLRHVNGEKIVVRNAKDGEKITTLDGEERELSSEMLVIADEKEATAVAGVMGGEYSGVYEDTNVVIFESACFDGPSVRRTAKKLGMRTESSGRFEKGLDSRNCENALLRACQLVEMLGAGTVATNIIDVDNDKREPLQLPFEPDWINELIGMDISTEEMEKILYSLDFVVEGDKVTVPSFRRGDMRVKNDIAEEVLRIYGYDKIPTTVLRGTAKAVITPEQKFRRNIINTLISQGYSEIITYSFYSPRNFDKLRLPADSPLRNYLTISNPLGEDTSVMRTTAIPSMLNILSTNYNNRNPQAPLFEVASIYLPTKVDERPEEPKVITIGEYGEDKDFFTLKGGVEAILNKFRIYNANWELVTDNPSFHPGRCAKISVDGVEIGIAGEIHPQVAENFSLGKHTYVAQLDYDKLFQVEETEPEYKALPKFPASTRDLALVSNVHLPVAHIQQAIEKGVGDILESIQLFDVYSGDQIEKGKKSVAYSLVLRGKDRTLTDEESDNAVKRALKELEKIEVSLRG